jgi:hypothetical protein
MKKPKNRSNSPSVTDPGTAETLPAGVAPATAQERAERRDEAELFASLRAEFGKSLQVGLWRSHQTIMMGKSQYVGALPLDDLKLETITSAFGGGDFIARAKHANGNYVEGGERRFSIDHSIPPKNPLAPPEKPAAVDVAGIIREINSATPKENTSALVQSMMQQNTQILLAALQRPEPKGEAAALMEMVKEMRNQADRAERRHQEEMELLREEIRGSRDTAPQKTFSEQLLEMKETAKMLGLSKGGDDDEGGNWWKDIGKGLGEVLIPLVKNHFAGGAPVGPIHPAAARRIVPQPQAALPAPPPRRDGSSLPAAGEVTVQPAEIQPTEEMNQEQIKSYLAKFAAAAVDAARKNKDAYEWTQTILGFVPAKFYPAIWNTANSADWFKLIFGDPAEEARRHMPFMLEIRDAVLSNAFVAHVQTFRASNTPKDTLAQFMGWVNRDFDDALLGATDDPNWGELWAGELDETPETAAWLAELRAAIIAELDPQTESAKVVDIAAAAPAPSAETGAPVSSKKPSPKKRSG